VTVGCGFARCSRVRYTSYTIGGTIDGAGKKVARALHKAQERYSIRHFSSLGYRVFPRHIGLHHVKGWADFAITRYHRVVLVECMSDWFLDQTITRKAELAAASELWFITEPGGMEEIQSRGYHCEVLPCPDDEEFRDLKTTFWICRPRGAGEL